MSDVDDSSSILDLTVWALPEFVSDGTNGFLSWTGPVVSTPAGLGFSLYTRAIAAAAPSLRHCDVAATARIDGEETRIGWARESSDDHAVTTFSLPDLDPHEAPLEFEMTLSDITTDGVWTGRWSRPIDTRVVAPASDPRGRLAMLTDPAFISSEKSLRTWLSPVTLDPDGLEFDYTAMSFGDTSLSMWDYDVTAVLRSSFGTLELARGESTSASRTRMVYRARVPHDIANPPWDFELIIRDHTAETEWSTTFSWNGPGPIRQPPLHIPMVQNRHAG
ncbi:hypothetical protein ACWDSJ_29025 [Nocardia sp. NPDC003482]